MRLLTKFISTIPAVKKELRHYEALAQTMPEPLRRQALSSIASKAFHCVGGSVYAHYPGANYRIMLPLIVTLQTISDYLDNLCDNMNVSDVDAFRLLHQSLIHALTPNAPIMDYYELYPYSENTYLPQLVSSCQRLLGEIPYYKELQPLTLELAGLYSELQALKHISPGGDLLLKDWVMATSEHTELAWNEWAAACGSTLGIFLLMGLAFQKPEGHNRLLIDAYFPWVQSLHILLDYLIDLEEDQQSGDLNFVSFYTSQESRDHSLVTLAQKCKGLSKTLPASHFHRLVVDGLIALYGSDPKVAAQEQESTLRKIASDRRTAFMLRICKALRRTGLI